MPKYLPALLSALLGIALYAISVGGTYIYDDVDILQTDPRAHDPSQWKRYWTDSYNQGVDNLYRPLVSMTYAIEWQLHGDRPWIFHLINVLLHGAVAACIAEFARRLLGSAGGLIAGLLFAAHPIHVEAVANIVGRAELMCALGIFAALILFLKPMTRWRALSITGCFLLALLSKEQGMLLPLLLLILWFTQRKNLPAAKNREGMLLLVLMLCWLLAGYIIWREHILKFWWDANFIDWTINPMIPSKSNPHGGSVGIDRWLMPLVLLGHYTALLIAPVKLSIDYGAKVIGWSVRLNDPYLYIGILSVITWMALFILAAVRRWAACGFALLALALTYGVVGNIVTYIGTNFGERLMYLPSAFFLIAIAAMFIKLPRTVLIAFTTIALLLGSIRTYTYAAQWNDKLQFYKTSLQQQPNAIRLYMLVTAEDLSRGNLDDAQRVVAQGRERLPEYWEIWLQSGVVAMDRGEFDEAQKFMQHAMDIQPSLKVQGWLEKLEQRRR
ncbi:MAG TPA: glycosyltransferase family 39 protein, partial [Tepidisphaeraceae bacterium]|nr:glycosyltransferase family 39 protein [Tepidisphaeraceae bacterium]